MKYLIYHKNTNKIISDIIKVFNKCFFMNKKNKMKKNIILILFSFSLLHIIYAQENIHDKLIKNNVIKNIHVSQEIENIFHEGYLKKYFLSENGDNIFCIGRNSDYSDYSHYYITSFYVLGKDLFKSSERNYDHGYIHDFKFTGNNDGIYIAQSFSKYTKGNTDNIALEAFTFSSGERIFKIIPEYFGYSSETTRFINCEFSKKYPLVYIYFEDLNTHEIKFAIYNYGIKHIEITKDFWPSGYKFDDFSKPYFIESDMGNIAITTDLEHKMFDVYEIFHAYSNYGIPFFSYSGNFLIESHDSYNTNFLNLSNNGQYVIWQDENKPLTIFSLVDNDTVKLPKKIKEYLSKIEFKNYIILGDNKKIFLSGEAKNNEDEDNVKYDIISGLIDLKKEKFYQLNSYTRNDIQSTNIINSLNRDYFAIMHYAESHSFIDIYDIYGLINIINKNGILTDSMFFPNNFGTDISRYYNNTPFVVTSKRGSIYSDPNIESEKIGDFNINEEFETIPQYTKETRYFDDYQIFNEEFLNNNNKWDLTNTNDYYSSIDTGFLQLLIKHDKYFNPIYSSNAIIQLEHIDFRNLKDFIIECTIEIINGNSGNFYFQIGDSSSIFYSLYSSNDIKIGHTFYSTDGKWIYKENIFKSPQFYNDTDKKNILFKIIKYGNIFYFYINNILIDKDYNFEIKGKSLVFSSSMPEVNIKNVLFAHSIKQKTKQQIENEWTVIKTANKEGWIKNENIKGIIWK